MLVIFSFSSRPTVSFTGSATASFFIYKSFHLAEYALLFILLLYAIKDIKYSILIAYLYGMSDEFHQTFISGRTGCIRDTLIDLIGITIGVIFVIIIKRFKFFKNIF